MVPLSPVTVDAGAGLGVSLKIGSWNCNQGLESRISDINSWIAKFSIDVLMLQDTGIINGSKWIMIQKMLKGTGFRCIAKSYVPNDDAKFTNEEKNYLRERDLWKHKPEKWPTYPAGSV